MQIQWNRSGYLIIVWAVARFHFHFMLFSLAAFFRLPHSPVSDIRKFNNDNLHFYLAFPSGYKTIWLTEERHIDANEIGCPSHLGRHKWMINIYEHIVKLLANARHGYVSFHSATFAPPSHTHSPPIWYVVWWCIFSELQLHFRANEPQRHCNINYKFNFSTTQSN